VSVLKYFTENNYNGIYNAPNLFYSAVNLCTVRFFYFFFSTNSFDRTK